MGSPLNCSRTLTANLTPVESKSKETFVSEDDPRFVDSSDDNMEIIMEAIDTKLLNNEMFKDMSENVQERALYRSRSGLTARLEESSTDLQVPSAMKQFLGKKLSGLIEQKYVLTNTVNLSPQAATFKKEESLIKLFCNSTAALKAVCSPWEYLPSVSPRFRIERRHMRTNSPNRFSKIRSVSIDYEFVQSQKEVRHWAKPSGKGKLYRYRAGKAGVLEFVEPENEFTKFATKGMSRVYK
ncbi:unnamed protein product [Hermetia illucens]|uniref:Uncharacterized protein n=1 Tax=Hermetia illucens TaxID=343691 RepID=A0A7R8UV99_HERIL|nr:uncharacterized protein LOC119656238 [Hermetia illucens]CAD7087780.1 unnamed protein product [Hermetia illucens]